METVSWRVPAKVPTLKLVAAALLGLLTWMAATETWPVVVGLTLATGLAAWAVRDLAVPVRLVADADGLTVVTGVARRVRLAWSQVERVRVDVRRASRMLAAGESRMLEIDTGEALYLLSRYDLDADLDELAGQLARLHLGATGRGGDADEGACRDG